MTLVSTFMLSSMTSNNELRGIVVTAHPDPNSATAATARAVAAGLQDGGLTDIALHDVLSEGFDSTFRAVDLAAYRAGTAEVPEDVRAQQRLLEGFDVVVVVFPVYWWSLPGALKGWVDRVFTRGWAYDDAGTGAELSAPKRLYFFGIGATNEATYRKHGYLDGMQAQLVDGLAGYMGADDSELVLLYDGESDDPARHAAREAAARTAAEAIALRATVAEDAA